MDNAAPFGGSTHVLRGSAAVRIPDLVQARLDADSLKLPWSWETSQLSQVTGELELSASADLAQLRPFLPESWLSASSSGRIRAHVSVAGEPGARYPKLRLAVSTQDLAWSLPADAGQTNAGAPGVVMQPERGTWQGMDVRLVTEVADSTITASAVRGSSGDRHVIAAIRAAVARRSNPQPLAVRSSRR